MALCSPTRLCRVFCCRCTPTAVLPFVVNPHMHCRIQRTNIVLSVLYGGGVCTPLLITLVHISQNLNAFPLNCSAKIVLMFITASVFYIFFQLFFILFCNRLIFKQL